MACIFTPEYDNPNLIVSAMTEAVVQLENGLDLLAVLPEGPQRQNQELDLRVALAPAVIASKGYAAPGKNHRGAAQ